MKRMTLAVLVMTAACTPDEARQQAAAQPAQSPVERGRYLVTAGGCDDCHTPKTFSATGMGLDSSRLLSGHPANEEVPPVPRGVLGPRGWGALASNSFTAWAGPWGISFTANLTPDSTGLQSWTDSLFIATMRTGKHLGNGRDILPPMPWQQIGTMTDDDLRAIFAYLQSVPPVTNRVPAPRPPAS